MSSKSETKLARVMLSISNRNEKRNAKRAEVMELRRKARNSRPKRKPTDGERGRCIQYINLKGTLPPWAPKHWYSLFVFSKALRELEGKKTS